MSAQVLRETPAAAKRRRTAADIMTARPWTCSPFSTVLEATVIFRDENCGAVPVVDEGRPVGVVTDRDVALAVPDYPNNLADRPVSDIMTRGVVAVRSDDPLDVVKEKFVDEFAADLLKVHRILVIDDDQLVGIISWADLVPHLPKEQIDEFVAEVVERPPSRVEKKEGG